MAALDSSATTSVRTADQGAATVAEVKKQGWREALSKLAAGYKPPPTALNDTNLSALAMPKAARIDQGEVPMFDPNAINQQRNQLALAMQKLNSGKLFL